MDRDSFEKSKVLDLDRGLSYIESFVNTLNIECAKLPKVTLKAAELNPGVLGQASMFGTITIDTRYHSRHIDEHTYVHEYAHALEAELGRKDLISMADRINAWGTGLYAKQIIRDAIKSLPKSEKLSGGWKSYANTVSLYATTDYSECLAECCAAQFDGRVSTFIDAVVSGLKKELHKRIK